MEQIDYTKKLYEETQKANRLALIATIASISLTILFFLINKYSK